MAALSRKRNGGSKPTECFLKENTLLGGANDNTDTPLVSEDRGQQVMSFNIKAGSMGN